MDTTTAGPTFEIVVAFSETLLVATWFVITGASFKFDTDITTVSVSVKLPELGTWTLRKYDAAYYKVNAFTVLITPELLMLNRPSSIPILKRNVCVSLVFASVINSAGDIVQTAAEFSAMLATFILTSVS